VNMVIKRLGMSGVAEELFVSQEELKSVESIIVNDERQLFRQLNGSPSV
jgi:hypothetical protein